MKTYFPRRPYKVCGHRVGVHAISRMRSRGVSKSALRYNLKHKPLHVTATRYKRGRPSYVRFSRNKVALAINPKTRHINSAWPYHTKLMERFLKGKK